MPPKYDTHPTETHYSFRQHCPMLTKAIMAGADAPLPVLRPYQPGDLWWDKLTIDPASLTAAWAKPVRGF